MNKTQFEKESLIIDLIDKYGTELKRLAFLYVKDYGLAEDVVQEVFIACYKKLDEFRHDSSYKTWLTKITINKSKDTLRRWSFRKLIYKAEVDKQDFSTPETNCLEKYEDECLINEVLNLPIKLREVILLYYYKELNTKEISGLLSISNNTVKSRLIRARTKMKIQIERSESIGKKN